MEDKLFPLKKVHSGVGRMTDTEISEVGMRHTHDAITTAIPALSGPRLSVYCSFCIKINQIPFVFFVVVGFTKCDYLFLVFQIP